MAFANRLGHGVYRDAGSNRRAFRRIHILRASRLGRVVLDWWNSLLGILSIPIDADSPVPPILTMDLELPE